MRLLALWKSGTDDRASSSASALQPTSTLRRLLPERCFIGFSPKLSIADLTFDMSAEDFKADSWETGKRLGAGSFGTVYEISSPLFKGQAAVKIGAFHNNSLGREFEAYKALNEIGAPGFCVIYHRLCDCDGTVKRLMLQRLGRSLYRQVRTFEKLSHPSALKVGLQILARIESLHRAGYLHCDIKPDNMMVGLDDPTAIYLIDLGGAKKYMKENGEHRVQCYDDRIVTTHEFASLNVHRLYTPSRRDDIESFVYSLIFMSVGTLPWFNICSDSSEAWEPPQTLIWEVKERITIQNLCLGQPPSFARILKHARRINYEDPPDYSLLFNLMREDLRRYGAVEDGVFEWNKQS